MHLDKLHFDDEFAALRALARAAAWFWLAVYVVVPLAMLVLLVLQERAPGGDPAAAAPRARRPCARRSGSESAVLLAVGVPLFAVPTTATDAVAVGADAVHRPGGRRLAARLRAGDGAGRRRR